jgi:tRNA1Val (adenine37-N6)-methyltransferase
MELRSGERLDDLGRGGLRVIQHPERFPFGMDPVLLAHFVKVRKRERVLDLGTGCGIIPLLLSALHPTALITGLELQPETAEMAARSVQLNDLGERVRIDCGDYRDVGRLYGYGSFDVVTINPPYREPGTGAISPSASRATARHELAGALADAMAAAAAAVKFGGRVGVVFLAERLPDLMVHMRSTGLEPKRLRLIHPREGRPANLLLLEAVKGGGAGLKVEPPLVIYAEGQT